MYRSDINTTVGKSDLYEYKTFKYNLMIHTQNYFKL